MVDTERSQILTMVQIDYYEFQVTKNAVIEPGCILWIKETRTMTAFEALGRFAYFDLREVLEFITRYVTSPALREEISKKRFEIYIESLSPTVFSDIKDYSFQDKEYALRRIFNLNNYIDQFADLSWKRRIMAKKFHPDRGGTTQSMVEINQWYEFLRTKSPYKKG